MKDSKDKIYDLHADLCKMLANPTRLKILEELKDGKKTVSDIVSSVDSSQSSVSQHLAELRKRDLVDTEKKGSNVYYSISNPKIIEACDKMKEVLFDQLSKNKELVERGDIYE